MRPNLQQSKRYRKFIADRDRAIERINQNTQIDLSRVLFETLEQIERLAAHLAIKSEGPFHMTHTLMLHFENGTRDILSAAFPNFLRRIISMRKATLIFTYASEMEAIGRATQKKKEPTRDEFKQRITKAINAETILGPLNKRVWLCILNLRHQINRAFELGLVQELKPQELVQKVRDAFPKIVVYKRPHKVLTPIKEAANPRDKNDWFSLSFIDDADWELAVDAYKDTELPPNRFDNEIIEMGYPEGYGEEGVAKYNWQLEQEVNEDFVKQVRDGQIAAIKDLGIKEMVWVAIIDDRTDDCCLNRNGMTSLEIENAMDAARWDDDCDASTPPAHFNCRCKVWPVTSTDEVEGPDWKSFGEWLDA